MRLNEAPARRGGRVRLPRFAVLAGAAYLVLVAWEGTEAPAPLLARDSEAPAAVAAAAIAPLPEAPPPAEPVADGEPERERGLASWYGSGFHGRATASGERFDMHGLTAAHRTLPFGTPVEVRNPANGRSVVVRINDRGPHSRRRAIDLSYAAARELGIVARGTAPIELRVLR